MAMQQRKRRRRSGGNNNNNNNPNKHLESNGPEVRIRGSAAQILEKYMQYARDAQTSGDRVKAEALYQHAEHYARIVAEVTKEQEKLRIEREARDAAKAEERAQRDAEERAERMAKAEARAAAEEAEPATDSAITANQEDQPAAPRRRTRKPRVEAGAPDAAVITDDTKAGAAPEKPKRRRKSYTPTEEAAEETGVLKTISRGAEPAEASESDA